MLEQTGNAVVFYVHYVASGVGATGLTVTVNVYRAGTLIVTAGNAVEVGDGLYSYTLASGSVTVDGEYAAVFKTAGTADQKHIAAMWVIGRAGIEHLDADVADVPDTVWDEALAGHATSGSAGAALLRIGSNTITIVSPVADDGAISLIYGDDYLAVDGRALDFTGTTWPAITTSTIALKVQAATALSFAGSVLSASSCRVPLTATQVATIGVGVWAYDLEATIGTSAITLAQDYLTVAQDVR